MEKRSSNPPLDIAFYRIKSGHIWSVFWAEMIDFTLAKFMSHSSIGKGGLDQFQIHVERECHDQFRIYIVKLNLLHINVFLYFGKKNKTHENQCPRPMK